MTPEQFTQILGLTETNGKIEEWGDDTHGTKPPLAMGRWQIHPAWLWDHTRLQGAKPDVLDSWDTWIGKLVGDFFADFADYITAVRLAMWFHVGHLTTDQLPDWDKAYAARFNAFAAKILP